MVKTKAASRKTTLQLQAIVGENVRVNRIAMNVSQNELARLTGHTQQYISQIEVGSINVTLNTTAGYFVTVTDSGSPAQSVTTRPNVVTYGMPAPAGGNTSGPTLAQVYALLQSQNSTVQTIATNTSGPATPRF